MFVTITYCKEVTSLTLMVKLYLNLVVWSFSPVDDTVISRFVRSLLENQGHLDYNSNIFTPRFDQIEFWERPFLFTDIINLYFRSALKGRVIIVMCIGRLHCHWYDTLWRMETTVKDKDRRSLHLLKGRVFQEGGNTRNHGLRTRLDLHRPWLIYQTHND